MPMYGRYEKLNVAALNRKNIWARYGWLEFKWLNHGEESLNISLVKLTQLSPRLSHPHPMPSSLEKKDIETKRLLSARNLRIYQMTNSIRVRRSYNYARWSTL